MGDLALLVEHWGYLAIFTVVVLGNVGLPVPEETILTLAGYLVWRGDVRFWPVLIVGIVSASAGDNFAYWVGRRFGSAVVCRYGAHLWISPARMEASHRFMLKYGALPSLSRGSFRAFASRQDPSRASPAFPLPSSSSRTCSAPVAMCRRGRRRLCHRTWSGTAPRAGSRGRRGG